MLLFHALVSHDGFNSIYSFRPARLAPLLHNAGSFTALTAPSNQPLKTKLVSLLHYRYYLMRFVPFRLCQISAIHNFEDKEQRLRY